MITRPAFKAKFHIETIPEVGFFLLSETECFVLEGPHLWHVIPLIDGFRTTDQIVAALESALAPQEVHAAIELLEREGHVQEADPTMPPEWGAFWSELNVDTSSLPTLFSNLSVQVLALGDIDPSPMEEIVRSFGVPVSTQGNFLVVIVDDYLNAQLDEINKDCLRTGTPWLLLKPTGVNIWLGPMFVREKTACWRCLENRLRNNRKVETYINSKKGLGGPFPVAKAKVPATLQQAYCMAAVQLMRWLTTGTNNSLESQLLIAETISLDFSRHSVVKRPQCPDCGNPSLGKVGGEPIHLQDGKMSFVSTDGGMRNEPPEVTFDRFSHHISPITGVVGGIYPAMRDGTGPLRIYVAGQNFALKSNPLYFLKDGPRTTSGGKGKSDAQARTSALCEALERHSGVFRGEEERITASFRDIKDRAIHPNDCMLFSEKQFLEREAWNSRGARFQVVPLPLDESAQIEWSPLYSYTEKRIKYLPTSYLYYRYPTPDDQFFCWADSNGNAAGSTLEDACLQGLFEVVERDSVCLWWYNRVQRPRLDLASFEDPYIKELQFFYASVGREFWVLDITSDTEVPAFAAINRRRSGPSEDIVFGCGAHLDARIAMMRAVTEMNQFIPAVLNVLEDGTTQYLWNDSEAQKWWREATVANQPYLVPLPAAFDKKAGDYPSRMMMGSVLDQLLYCFSILEELGMEILLLDQTRPDIGLNVVKVVVPGMRHFWSRYAPGRLYEIPVKLGWIKEPKSEDQLNPISVFI